MENLGPNPDLVLAKRIELDQTKSLLDRLRSIRKHSGGVGSPLLVPKHLKAAAEGHGIVITDSDLESVKLK
jgi:hypothetical protein